MARFDLTGRRALVTGASRGIGAGIARALDDAGARVALAARNREDLETIRSELEHDPVAFPVDLAGPAAPSDLADAVLQRLGGLDILVNNAALGIRAPTDELDAETVDRLLALNVRAPLLLIASLLPALRSSPHATVVNITSVSALRGTPRRAAYAASKGALEAATRSLARELGPDQIRVNAVAPGVVDTAMWARNKAIPGVVDTIESQTPLGRLGRADDVADVVLFLASDAARFVTGATVPADGGMGDTLDLYGGAV